VTQYNRTDFSLNYECLVGSSFFWQCRSTNVLRVSRILCCILYNIYSSLNSVSSFRWDCHSPPEFSIENLEAESQDSPTPCPSPHCFSQRSHYHAVNSPISKSPMSSKRVSPLLVTLTWWEEVSHDVFNLHFLYLLFRMYLTKDKTCVCFKYCYILSRTHNNTRQRVSTIIC
jgi:hypothetical protein